MTDEPDLLRTEQINLKLTPEETERLSRMAAHHALTPQSMLRMLLKRAADEFEATERAARTPAPKPRKR